MLRRLVEANYFKYRERPTRQQFRFWLLELRTPELLIELTAAQPQLARRLAATRSPLKLAKPGYEIELTNALVAEELSEREADRRYWAPLKKELETLRLARGRRK